MEFGLVCFCTEHHEGGGHCARIRKVAGSRPDGVNEFFRFT
jgi:hypothetical protein